MKNEEISLDLLIKKGQEIKDGLIYRNDAYIDYYKLSNSSDYYTWKNQVKRFLAVNYQNDFQLDDYNKAIEKFERRGYHSPDDLDSVLGILIGYRSITQTIDIQKKEDENGGDIIVTNNINQNQSQTQNQAVEIFIEAIKYDITSRQLDEIKNLIKDLNGNMEEAKPKIFEKLKSWGANVLSGVVTNIITNPAILNAL